MATLCKLCNSFIDDFGNHVGTCISHWPTYKDPSPSAIGKNDKREQRRYEIARDCFVRDVNPHEICEDTLKRLIDGCIDKADRLLSALEKESKEND